jgi:hypothetical protein
MFTVRPKFITLPGFQHTRAYSKHRNARPEDPWTYALAPWPFTESSQAVRWPAPTDQAPVRRLLCSWYLGIYRTTRCGPRTHHGGALAHAKPPELQRQSVLFVWDCITIQSSSIQGHHLAPPRDRWGVLDNPWDEVSRSYPCALRSEYRLHDDVAARMRVASRHVETAMSTRTA